MKKLMKVSIIILLTTAFAASAAASGRPSKKKNVSQYSSQSKLGAKLGTEFEFNDLSVRGRYQGAFESSVTVENEKQLEDLLDYRTEYKDRLVKSGMQR
jgi:flagellar basal body-associated protein FliL